MYDRCHYYRESEERYRARCLQMEDKFRLDKREIQHQVEQVCLMVTNFGVISLF